MPHLELLEGRRLLATVATAVDFNANPVVFTLGSDGTVFVNQQRPTGNLNQPYASAGLIAIPGLKATSITATQDAFGDLEVDATTGPESHVYRSTYGIPGPFVTHGAGDVWSAWTQVGGDFVAKSIMVTDPGVFNQAIFAIGADSNVYEYLKVDGDTDDVFQPIPGLSAASIAVIPGFEGYELFATTGPASYVYQTHVNFMSGSLPVAITSTPWLPIDSGFVATSIVAAADPEAGSGLADTNLHGPPSGVKTAISVLAVGANGGVYRSFQQAVAELEPTPFAVLGSVANGGLPAAVTSVLAQLDASGSVETFFALGTDGVVYTNQAQTISDGPGDLLTKSWLALNSGGNRSIAAAAGAGLAAEFVGRASNGYTTYQTAPALATSNGTDFGLNQFINPLRLDVAVRPIAVTAGLSDSPAVATIGNDGTVYVNQETVTGFPLSQAGGTGGSIPFPGWTTLPGIKAVALAAATEPDGTALFALTDTDSTVGSVYVNQFRPTGNDDGSHAWTGWIDTGADGVEGMAVANAGGTNSTAPTLIVIGPVDPTSTPTPSTAPVSVFTATAPTDPTQGDTFAQSTTLNGLMARTISATSTSNGIEVAALVGPETYASVNIYAPTSADPTVSAWGGWMQVQNYVATQVLATTGVSGNPAVLATSPDDQQGFSQYLPTSATASAWTNFVQVPLQISIDPTINASQGTTFVGPEALIYPDGAGGTYLNLTAAAANGVTGVGFTPGTAGLQSFPDDSTIASISALSLAASTAEGYIALYVGAADGQIYFNEEGVNINNGEAVLVFQDWQALQAVPT